MFLQKQHVTTFLFFIKIETYYRLKNQFNYGSHIFPRIFCFTVTFFKAVNIVVLISYAIFIWNIFRSVIVLCIMHQADVLGYLVRQCICNKLYNNKLSLHNRLYCQVYRIIEYCNERVRNLLVRNLGTLLMKPFAVTVRSLLKLAL